jgi:tetraacyldisaccharide 4'-kinase
MTPATWLLLPLSALYGTVLSARNHYFERVKSAVKRTPVPVISIGNITVGGTGKTPLVIEVVRRLRAWQRRPVILTRGYRGRAGELADEVHEFHASVADVPVVVDPDRVRGAASGQREYQADCLVLDDGFQHRRLGRNLDLVLIDALNPWGGGQVLPAGRLREPLRGLRRASAFVITRANQVDAVRIDSIIAQLRRSAGDKPIFSAAIEPVSITLSSGETLAPDVLRGQRVFGVAGIGNPQTFTRLLSTLTQEPSSLRTLPDHYRYAPPDATALAAEATRAGAALVVTTRKDWVKLAPLWVTSQPVLARLDVRLTLVESAMFDELLRRTVEVQP